MFLIFKNLINSLGKIKFCQIFCFALKLYFKSQNNDDFFKSIDFFVIRLSKTNFFISCNTVHKNFSLMNLIQNISNKLLLFSKDLINFIIKDMDIFLHHTNSYISCSIADILANLDNNNNVSLKSSF